MMKTATLALALATLALSAVAANAATIIPTWTTDTINIASADTTDNSFDLSVFRTSWADATANLGTLDSGSVRIKFKWTIKSEGWYELPAVSLSTNGSNALQFPTCSGNDLSEAACGDFIGLAGPNIGNLKVVPYTTTTGHFSENVNVSGFTNISFVILPSFYSYIADHRTTSFSATDVSFTFSPKAVPEPTTWALMLIGIGGIGGIMRRNRLAQC